jgi:tetratricopeptide (TPR) repeat protein
MVRNVGAAARIILLLTLSLSLPFQHNEVDEALELFQSVLRSHKDKYGEIHHLVGTANHNIGVVCLFAERYTNAMTFFGQAVSVRKAALGPEHPDVAASLMKIGMIQLVRRDPEEARDTFLEVLKLVRKVLGYGHIQVARVLNNLAVAQYDLGANLDAFHTFQQAHAIQRRLLLLSRTAHIYTVLDQTNIIELALANTLSNMGFIYCRQKKYGDSARMLQEASKLRRKHLESHHLALENGDANLHFVGKILSDIKEQESAAKSEKGGGFFDFVAGALNLTDSCG